jgi:chemotaxis protein histidine kinase CheA
VGCQGRGEEERTIVDELIGQQEIVIKPLGKLLYKSMGSPVLRFGLLQRGLILDVASLAADPRGRDVDSSNGAHSSLQLDALKEVVNI